jgi:LysM repeat protein
MTQSFRSRWLLVGVAAVLLLQLVLVGTVSAAPPQGGPCFWYTVRWGDSLSSIAFRFGDSIWGLQARNGIANPNFVRAGQVLQVCHSFAPPPMHGVFHRVLPGETLFSIARFYGTTPWAIASMNGIFNMNLIFAGQVLRVL